MKSFRIDITVDNDIISTHSLIYDIEQRSRYKIMVHKIQELGETVNNEDSFFPIKILVDDKIEMICNSPKDIPNAKGFRVIQTKVTI